MKSLANVSLPKNKTLLVIGCGYLGAFVIEHSGNTYQNTIAVVRSSKRIEHLRSKLSSVHMIDVFAQDMAYESMLRGESFDVIFMIPPSAIGQNANEAGEAMHKIVGELANGTCSSALLISSTGIYGNPDREVVTAETVPEANSARSERLTVIEDRWLSGGEQFKVLRLAGIYGPERIIGQRALMHGEVIGGKPEAWLNLIHVEDAATLSMKCLGAGAAKIELGSDGNPVRRKDYYNYVAGLLGYLPAQFSDGASQQEPKYPIRTSNGKKCDPSSTFRRLQWRPRFEDYTSGLSASVDITREQRE